MATTRDKVRSGLRWTAVGSFGARLVTFANTALLARYLDPTAFGVVAMANVVIAMLGHLRELGLGAAYVHQQFESEAEERLTLDTAFYILLGLNVALFVVGFGLAPVMADFYRTPEVTPILQVLISIVLVDTFVTIPLARLQKQLAFDRAAASEILAAVASLVVAVPMALAGFGAWSLVASQLAGRLVNAGSLVVLARWWPRLEFSRERARELVDYGRYLWAFHGVRLLGGMLDRLFIGRVIGSAPLGAYALANNLARLPVTQISFLVNRVTFPAMARHQGDTDRLRRGFLTALAYVSVVAFPVSVGMAVAAQELIRVIYGPQWGEAVDPLRVLALVGLVFAVSAVTAPVIQATGKPRPMLVAGIVQYVLLAVLLLGFTRLGLVAVCLCVLAARVANALISFAFVGGRLELGPSRMLQPVAGPALASAAMAAAGLAVRSTVGDLPSAPRLAVMVVACAAVYGGASLVVNRATFLEVAGMLRSMLVPRRRRQAPAGGS